MRIISGRLKGRVLVGFDIDGTRPTMDRVKESLFAMLQNDIDNSVVLDLFAGSGNLGIESYSEGAEKIVLVDNNRKAIEIMKRNVENLMIGDRTLIYSLDYKRALLELKNNKMKFDIIFLDPPYQTNYIEKSLKLIEEYRLLSEDGIVVCESDIIDKIIYSKFFTSVKNKRYGDKYIVFLKLS